MQMCLPCDQPFLRAQASQRDSKLSQLTFEVERALVNLIQKECTLALEVELMKQLLAGRYDFTADKLFTEIDDLALKFLDTQGIKRFMVKARMYPTDEVLICLVRRLDLNSDARLARKEFIDGITPMENYTKGSVIQFAKAVAAMRPDRPQPAVEPV